MSDFQPDPSWWVASDGKWYPYASHPSVAKPETSPPPRTPPSRPAGPTVIGTAGAGPTSMAERSWKGAQGERATHEALLALSGYVVAHGLKIGRTRGDIDHLVIGPTGVWVIDTKNWSGNLTAGNGMLWRGRQPIRKEIAGVEAQAAHAQSVLGLAANPVLCFVNTGLPRPAQMVGRTRVVSLDALVPHLQSSPSVLSSQDVDLAARKVEAWKRNPPASQSTTQAASRTDVTPASSSESLKSQPSVEPKGISGRSMGLVLLAAFLVFGFIQSRSDEKGSVGDRRANEATSPTVTAAPTTPSTAPPPAYFSAQVECLTPGGGYTVKGHAGMLTNQRIRVTATIGGAPLYLGEFSTFQRVPPIPGQAPSSSVGFDIQSVDLSGQAGETYRVDVVMPDAPC